MPDELALFMVDRAPTPPAPTESKGVRRTKRQAAMLTAGLHPLTAVVNTLRLHAEAAPADDRQADGRRCGNCQFREVLGYHSCGYPKCTFSKTRMSHGDASDVRAWWPACVDHEWKEPHE